MKLLIPALLLPFCSIFAGTYKSEPLTGSDIATILQLSASRNSVSFDKPQELVLEYEVSKSHQMMPLGKAKSISIVTYSPSKDGGIETLGIIVYKDDSSSFSTYLPSPAWQKEKGRFTRTSYEGNVFRIEGSNEEDFSSLSFRLQISPKKVEQDAAANP